MDSQASFSRAAMNAIRQTYNWRCIVCLTNAPVSQCAHIIDTASAGERQVHNAAKLGILREDYQWNSAMNGMVQCPSCHCYFTQNFVVLSLPIPVLQYLQKYLQITPKARQKPLHKVFDLLLDALRGTKVPLPDLKAIFPYLGLFTMVTLNPTRLATVALPTVHMPNLSIVRGRKFIAAPSNTSATVKNAARIFDPSSVDDNNRNSGYIPLSSDVPGFEERRFWRLPLPEGAIFAALMERLQYDTSECEDILLAKGIRSLLELQILGLYPDPIGGGDGPRGPSGSAGNDSGTGGGGPSKSGRGSSKRKGGGGNEGGSSSKDPKKIRQAAGGYNAAVCDELGDTSGFALRTRTRRGQPDTLEIAPSTSNLKCGASRQLAVMSQDDSESEDGLSVSAISPHGADNPDEWRFGPSFTTNRIIFSRAVNLT